jgi:hypothetical protein
MNASLQKKKRGHTMSQTSPSTVGFRLDPEHGCILAGRASALGVNPHELAHGYVKRVPWVTANPGNREHYSKNLNIFTFLQLWSQLRQSWKTISN